MHRTKRRSRGPTWCDLSKETLRSIAKLLEDDDPFSLRHFRMVCKNWNHSTTISHLLPRPVNTTLSLHDLHLYSSLIHLVHPPSSTSTSTSTSTSSSWLVSSFELSGGPTYGAAASSEPAGHIQYRQIFTETSFPDLSTGFNVNQFPSRQLDTAYRLSYIPDGEEKFDFVKVLVSSPKSVPCIGDCAVLALCYGGSLGGFPPFAHHLNDNDNDGDQVELPWIDISHVSVNKFDDIVEYKRMIITVDRQGKLYEIDPYTLEIIRVYVSNGFSNSTVRGWRKRLVSTPAGKLYLLVRKNTPTRVTNTNPLFKIYKLSDDGKVPIWVEVTSFENNQVLFVTEDCCFFVNVDELGSKRGKKLKNCMVFSQHAFQKYSKYGWTYSNLRIHQDDVGVFKLGAKGQDTSAFLPVLSFLDFPIVLDSSPPWALQTPTSMQSEQEESNHETREDDEEEQDESYDQEDESNHETREDDEEESNSRPHDDESASDYGNWEDQVPQFESNTEVNPAMGSSISLAAQQDSSRGENTHSVTRAYITSISKSSQSGTSKVIFEGLNICSELVPTLEKIWSKHRNIMESIAIRNGDIVAKILESLANAVQILEKNTARSLNDDQVDYLSSTLSDLQLGGFKVDWLASSINNALAHHKSKYLMGVLDSLKGLAQVKAQAVQMKSKLLDELAKFDQMENELDSEIARVTKSIPNSVQLDFDKTLGEGLL